MECGKPGGETDYPLYDVLRNGEPTMRVGFDDDRNVVVTVESRYVLKPSMTYRFGMLGRVNDVPNREAALSDVVTLLRKINDETISFLGDSDEGTRNSTVGGGIW